MGGVGKTYLLQHVFNDIKDRYDKSAWLSVSRFYSLSKLQRDLAFQLDEDLSKRIKESGVSEVVVEGLINKFMLEKRCLVVLDDVWRAGREDNLLTKLGIPDGSNSQCKILVSTRIREVCVNLNAEIYEIECLTDEESWMLFCSHAFPKCRENRPPYNLEKLARNIERKCGKLPLAIKVVAASLERTVEVSEWEAMFDKLKKVGTSKEHVIDIFKLSYNLLPAHEKACFAYFSFFPEDEKIECEFLMHLWMAEGFILVGKNPWDCLDHLANLCLVEVWEDEDVDIWEMDPYQSRVKKYCRIHDLLLDLAIAVSAENKCAFGLDDVFSRGGVRWCRLFLAKRDIDDNAIWQRRPVSTTLVRTLSLSSNIQIGIGRNIPETLFSGMRVLRVLDLSHTNISTLPASVGELKLLKVLNLRNTKIKIVPKCVRSLKSLCYLNVSISNTKSLLEGPDWIGELRCLQHLEGSFWAMSKGIMKVGSLRTLRTEPLFLSTSMQFNALRIENALSIEDVGKMGENLEEIAFRIRDESELKRMEEGILAPLKKMRRLTVWSVLELDLPQFPETMSAMKDLEDLTLYHFAVPRWICCLTNLKYLCLRECHCSDHPEFQRMPNLVSLRLAGNYACRALPEAFGKSGGFPRLRFLYINYFHELEEFPELEEGAMPCLEMLKIQRCEKLSKGGEGVERLKRLRLLDFGHSGRIEWRETFEEGGINWAKIKARNPQVTILVED